jgi:uncharacterized protein YgbK (DUF1537 family)
MSRPILGCIADDLTGATDLANNLARAGMRVVLTVDVPQQPGNIECDALVVALQSRTIPASAACELSLQTCRWLRSQGAQHVYFKICSTFDSTVRGNIGPVIESLMDELRCGFCAVVPAFPDAGRTVRQGELFVDNVPLSESSMRNHPLTPMSDSNLGRFLQAQLDPTRKRRVGLIGHTAVAESAEAIRAQIHSLHTEGMSIAIVDTLNNADLRRIGGALMNEPLVTASSGLGMVLPAEWGFQPSLDSSRLPVPTGRKAILAGSCSTATRAQVQHFLANGGQAFCLDPFELAADTDAQSRKVLTWAASIWTRNPTAPVLVYSTAEPASVQAVQAQLGAERSGKLVESALAGIAHAFVADGVGQLIVAGGETAGACIRRIHGEQMQIGPQIDPGVPWCYASSTIAESEHLHLALKSGNFGRPDFFTRAFMLLQ